MSRCVKVDTLGRLCNNDLERPYDHFTTTKVYFIGAAYNFYFLIIYKPSSLITSSRTFSMQLGAGTAWFCLSQCAIPFCTLSTRQTCPKLFCPLDFNGECHNGCAFLNSCSLYICLAPEQFHDKQERILWALMFFKGGRAAKWSKNIFCQEADTGVFPIQTWGEFEQQFQLHFFPANTKADVINTLEGTFYHQGNQTVDDYLDSFQALVSDTDYMDPRTLVVKFRRGL